MTRQNRTIWDDLIELGRDIIDQIDEALHPDKKRRPARVPVPVRNNPRRDHYNDDQR